MQGSFIPAFGSSSSRSFGSAEFKARREALTRVLTAGFVLPDASGSWSSAALCAHPGLIPIRLSSGVLIGRTAPEWADKISRMPGITQHQTGLRLDAAHLLDFGIAMRAAHLSQGWRGELLDLFSLSGVCAKGSHCAPRASALPSSGSADPSGSSLGSFARSR